METANTFRRVLAFLIDSFISGLCFLPVWIQLLGAYFTTGVLKVSVPWLLVGLLLQLFYNWMFLYFLGGTVGKLIFGLRVVPSADPSRDLGLFQSFLRVVTDALSLFFGQALRALALVRLDRTHVSDWVAETRVMQFKHRRSPPIRHWILAGLIVVFSFLNQFERIYLTVQNAHWERGEIIFDASY